MRGMLLYCLLLTACATNLGGGFPDANAYDKGIRSYYDHSLDKAVISVQFASTSEEERGMWQRFSLKMDLIRPTEGEADFVARFVVRGSAEEWPLDDNAFLIVDAQKTAIELTEVNPRSTTKISGSAMDGNVSISTSESQIFRLVSNIPHEALREIGDESNVLFVFHSGIYPVTFKLDPGEVRRAKALVAL